MNDYEIKPTPKQAMFLASDADVCLFGGAAGPGKTFSLLVDSLGLVTECDDFGDLPLSRIELPHYRALIVRRQYKHLYELIDKSKVIYKGVDPGAIWLESKMVWRFTSGAEISMMAIEDQDGLDAIQGREFQYIGYDEVGQLEHESTFLYLLSRLRSSQGVKCYLRATSNPSRYPWLRKFFAIRPSGASTSYTKRIQLPDGTIEPITVEYIQAKSSDNPHLGNDYQVKLSMLAEDDRRAMQDGAWDAYDTVDGQVYIHELRAMQEQRRVCRVHHDPAASVYTYWDLGIKDNTVVLFVQFIGKEVHIIKKLESNNRAIPQYIADIKNIEKDDGYRIAGHYLPHDAAAREKFTGKSVKEQVEQMLSNVTVLPCLEIEQGIQSLKIMFPNLWIDEATGVYEHLYNYKRAYNSARQIYEKPIHDIHSHCADTVRYISYKQPSTVQAERVRPKGRFNGSF